MYTQQSTMHREDRAMQMSLQGYFDETLGMLNAEKCGTRPVEHLDIVWLFLVVSVLLLGRSIKTKYKKKKKYNARACTCARDGLARAVVLLLQVGIRRAGSCPLLLSCLRVLLSCSPVHTPHMLAYTQPCIRWCMQRHFAPLCSICWFQLYNSSRKSSQERGQGALRS